ncbi:LysR family transcriptional regulator [Paraburkholderia phytofirmans]|uniref:LysR family transcriptional regulator n=1 Tax=Paraburkholderia phytofirmans TaxID=261302 RepID=UPI0038B75570
MCFTHAILGSKSFTAAAAELSVTITAVSHQIRQLEARIGHKLFERTGRAVTLTPVGKTIYPLVRDDFDQIAEAFEAVSGHVDEDSIQISATRAFAQRWLMPRLSRFNAIHPDITVHNHGSEKTVDLGAEDIDLVIRYGLVETDQRDSVILEDRYIAVAERGICPEDRVPTIEDFRQRPLLAYNWANPALNAPDWSAWLALVEHDQTVDFRISWYSEEMLALYAAECGLGPLMCSNVLIDEELRTGRLRRIEGPCLPGFLYRLVEMSSPRRKKSLGLFTKWLREEAQSFRDKSAVTGKAPKGISL